jgi:hypothetical protein
MAVGSIISDANTRVANARTDADTFLQQLADIANDNSFGLNGNWVIRPWNSGIFDNIDVPQPADVSIAAPGTRAPDVDVDDPSDVPDLKLPYVWTDTDVPEFTETPPSITFPATPTTPLPTEPSEHEVQDITLLPFTEYALPDAPVIDENPLPSPSALNIEAVDLTLPQFNLVAPSNNFSYVEEDYSSNLLTAVETLLQGDIENGGYGINDADEQLLWERQRDRSSKQSAGAIARVHRGVAARKFPLPPGSLYAAERAAIQEADEQLSDVNRDIALRRSELYVQARQFAVQQGITLEQALLSFTGAKFERALNAARATADFAIQFHNTSVQLFQLQVELRRLYRDLHAEHLETAVARTREYQMEIDRSDAEARRNESRLRVHNQLLEAVKIAYEAQTARDQHALAELEVERLKLQASQDRTNIYVAKVRARSDEFEAYRTAVQGEEAKIRLFEAQVRAHNQQLQTSLGLSELRQRRFEAEIQAAVERRNGYELELRRHELLLREAIAKAETDSRYNDTVVNIWRQQVQGAQFNVNADFQRDVQKVEKYLDGFRVNIENMSATARTINDFKELRAAAARSAIGIFEQAIAGAETSLNAIATLTEQA